MNGHVTEEILDYYHGRLSPRREEEVRSHLDDCADCSSYLDAARLLDRKAARDGLKHLFAQRIVEISENRGEGPTAAERSHLESCFECRQEIEWLRESTLQTGSETGRGERRKQAWISPIRRNRLLALGGLAAAACILLMIRIDSRGPAYDLTHLASLDPLPVKTQRMAPPPESAEARFRDGLEAYKKREYIKAGDQFRNAIALDPDHPEAGIYLGSALLLAGDARSAKEALEAAIGVAETSIQVEEAQWQLANAFLMMDDRRNAQQQLERLVEIESVYSESAEKILRILRAE